MIIDHEVKCLPLYFENHANGSLPVTIRKDDRNYKAEDIVEMHEWTGTQYTGRSKEYEITSIYHNHPGLLPGYVLVTIKPVGVKEQKEHQCLHCKKVIVGEPFFTAGDSNGIHDDFCSLRCVDQDRKEQGE